MTPALLLFCALSAWLGIALLLGYARKKLLDRPNARSAHRQPTPRGAGLAMVVSILLVWSLAGWPEAGKSLFFWPLWAGLPIAWIGWRDDHGHVPARWRLLVHGICSAVALAWLFFPEPGFFWPGLLALLPVMVWSLNLFNFMDGIDGLAGSEALFLASVMAVLLMRDSPELAFQAGLIAAASAGFLFWNWPKAKIFLGDVGSGFLGFVLALTVIEAGSLDLRHGIAGIILSAGFWVDASLTLLTRMLTGQTWYQAHNLHGYQKAARRFGAVKVLWFYWTVNVLWLLPWSLVAFFHPEAGGMAALIAVTPLILAAMALRAGQLST